MVVSGVVRVTGVLLIAGGMAACNPELQLVTPPPPPDSTGGEVPRDTASQDTTGGTVQRAALVVTVETIGGGFEDFALFQDLGWTEGPLAGGEVEAHRRHSTDQRTGVTDSAGQVRFTELLPGTWDVSVLRVLTAEERARLRPELEDVTGFAGGAVVTVAAPSAAVELAAIAGRRGSLVISEVFFTWPFLNDNSYVNATYIELYNNSDTTIYLDGKLVGQGPSWWWDFGETQRGFFPCSLTQQWQNDPDGLWSPDLLQLPGTGTQYALAPGEVAVVATDGIDHGEVDPRLPDLAAASFETIGSADIDNPAVPNATIVVQEFLTFLGRGIVFHGGIGVIYFVADRVDLAMVPWMRPGNYNKSIPRIPADAILDVFASKATTRITQQFGEERFCEHFINAHFDRREGRFFDGDDFYAIVRLSLGSVDGRIMLQRTKTSARDYTTVVELTPGLVP